MRIFIPKARIIHPQSAKNDTVQDLWIENGKLHSAPENASEIADKIYEEGLCVSPGWVDLRARSFDPGFPEKENLRSLLAAGSLGGFTHIGIMPDSAPSADQRSILEYWKSQSLSADANPVFLGSLSKKNEGQEIAELFDLKEFGAKAYTDVGRPIKNTLFLKVAMEYASMTELTLILRPDDPYLYNSGEARESAASHNSGMASIPDISEKLGIDKICEMAAYTGCKVHLSSISTGIGVESIKAWKDKGLEITADVTAAHLTTDDSTLQLFDSHFKHLPPLPTKVDRKLLVEAVKSGVIDIICSDHHPVNVEKKFCEFHLAEEGISSIQATYSLLKEGAPELDEQTVIQALSLNPRSLFGMQAPKFEEGEVADYTIFNPEGSSIYRQDSWKSVSKNFPYFNKELKGEVKGSIKPLAQ